LKGVDVATAAYLSEIAYLASPVSTHVISAEMHNQSINSLALLSGRYTFETVKLCRMLMSSHIYALCQAADLRAMEAIFRKQFFPLIRSEIAAHFPGIDFDDEFIRVLTNRLILLLNGTTDQDSVTRFQRVLSDLTSTLLTLLDAFPVDISTRAITAWNLALAKHAQRIFVETREAYGAESQSAAGLLGRTSALYTYVRGELGVKLHWGTPSKDHTAIGTEIGKIFHAWKTPKMAQVLLSILEGRDVPAKNGVTN